MITKKYNIADIDFRLKAGTYLKNIRDGNDLADRGFFMITDTSYNRAEQRSQDILNEIRSSLYE